MTLKREQPNPIEVWQNYSKEWFQMWSDFYQNLIKNSEQLLKAWGQWQGILANLSPEG
jgi:hypothetical protein